MDGKNVFIQMDMHLLERLDLLREFVNEPLHITSSYRTEDYNSSVGGSKTSYHLKGRAVDLRCNNGALRLKIIENAIDLGLSVGVHKLFVHIDNRDKQIIFTY